MKIHHSNDNEANLFICGVVMGFVLGALVVMAIVFDGWLPNRHIGGVKILEGAMAQTPYLPFFTQTAFLEFSEVLKLGQKCNIY